MCKSGIIMVNFLIFNESSYKTSPIITCTPQTLDTLTMTTSGQIMIWSDCLKTKGNVRLYCLHFAQYILISPHGIDCRQTLCKKIYRMDRVS